LWAYEHYGIEPDIMLLAKALGGGLPVGAALVTDAVAEVIEPGDHGSTFAAGPVACRAAQVVLDRVSDPAMLDHVTAMGELLKERLEEINSPHIKEIRGLGLMIGVEMDCEVAPLIQAAYTEGVILLNAGANVLRLLPAYILSEADIDEFISVLQQIISA
jgi:acetylornithine/succinyldiaminopimelate/putrescine aminotransferase